MRRALALLVLIGSIAAAAPAWARADGFILVNATQSNITAMAIRRTGTADWQPLAATPSAGARTAVAFDDPDCAFDLRATLAGGASATWGGVNLCEVTSVTLNRDPASGESWVDYD